MKRTICNMCGKEFDLWDDIENFNIYKYRMGYGTKYDDHSLQLDLCCDCMEKIIDMCKINPTTDLESRAAQDAYFHTASI